MDLLDTGPTEQRRPGGGWTDHSGHQGRRGSPVHPGHPTGVGSQAVSAPTPAPGVHQKGQWETAAAGDSDGRFILHLHTGGFGIVALLEQALSVGSLVTLAR